MPSYERMRDRLPSLWRPEDDDASGDALELGPGDVVVECEPEREPRFTVHGGTVVATLDAPARVKALRIAPERALETGCAVEIYRMAGSSVQSRPALSAVVRGGRAALPVDFEGERFGIRLRRPGLISLLLRMSADAVDRLDREAADVMQSHWQPHADRALLSPFWHRGRALRRLIVPRPGDRVDLPAPAELVERLRAPDTPFVTWLAQRLSERTLGLMAKWVDGPVPDPLQRALADEVDALVEGELVHTAARFQGVALDADTLDQLADPPVGGLDLVLLNRRLMEQALPGLILASSLDSPWVDDLARIGSILALPHWREPVDEPESVEEYRARQRRVVALFADGLGTVSALRRMVEAQLPLDGDAPAERQDRGFLFEESPAVGREIRAAETDGAPDRIVGPLMRWRTENTGEGAVPATVYIQGVEPDGDLVRTTERPVVELFSAGDAKPRIGIGYDATLPPGTTLRLRPAYTAWIGRDNGLFRADGRPSADAPANPVPAAPWSRAEDTPSLAVSAMTQTRDRAVWAVFGIENSSLWRADHAGWTSVLPNLPPVRALLEDGDSLLLGCEDGLRRVPLFPAEGQAFKAAKLVALAGRAVYALARLTDGRVIAGTARGASHVVSDAAAAPFVLDPSLGTETPVYALEETSEGSLYIGCSKGLFLHRPTSGETWWLANADISDQLPDWQPLNTAMQGAARNFPSEARVFIPPVRCVHRGPDASLWLGTDAGIARYIARPARGLTYTTVVEAYPDLVTGRVHSMREDERGGVWFCTDRGVFRHDGRDFWQLSGGRWGQLGRAELRYGVRVTPRPAYRFDRASWKWQAREEHAWIPAHDALRSSNASPVRSVLWTDAVEADLGTWDGTAFTPTGPADRTKLRVRYKPTEERIVTGGIPAVPRLPVGVSTWRYLSLEGAGTKKPALLPAWSVEGRLFAPPQHPAPYPGRFDLSIHGADDGWDHVAFAYAPSARVWTEWSPRRPLTVLARLQRKAAGETIDPAVLERVWQGMKQVKPAGVRALLAVEETIVRGNG